MRDKSLKFKRPTESADVRRKLLRKYIKDACKVEFIVWAENTSLDILGIHGGEPVFRPAICAWEAWKACWSARKGL